jgi:hypothetical protein
VVPEQRLDFGGGGVAAERDQIADVVVQSEHRLDVDQLTEISGLAPDVSSRAR